MNRSNQALDRLGPKKYMKINKLDHRLCLAPMMDWTESSINSNVYDAACARFAHEGSTSLSFSFSRGVPIPASGARFRSICRDVLRGGVRSSS